MTVAGRHLIASSGFIRAVQLATVFPSGRRRAASPTPYERWKGFYPAVRSNDLFRCTVIFENYVQERATPVVHHHRFQKDLSNCFQS
jgi:hypothetical protein